MRLISEAGDRMISALSRRLIPASDKVTTNLPIAC